MLVTGGAGFIGSNFVHMISQGSEYEVTVLDKFTYASNLSSLEGLESSNVKIVSGDICDPKIVDEHLSRHEYVVNFAAESHNDNSLKDPYPFIESNILGTYNLLESARKYGNRFHHISTDEVFGDFPIESLEKFTEESPYRPSSPYSASKASSDLLVKAWHRSFGVKATITNCSNNYGPRQHIEKFIPRQITSLLQGGNIELYGAGANIRDWIHVDDHNQAVLDVIERGELGETYLIGANCEKSNFDVATILLKIFDLDDSRIKFVPDRAGHDLRYAIDASKIQNLLNWSPKFTNFEDGLNETISWYRNNSNWWKNSTRAPNLSYGN